MSKNSALASINLRLAGVDVKVIGSADALMAVGMDVSTQYQLMRHGSKEAREAISACGDLLAGIHKHPKDGEKLARLREAALDACKALAAKTQPAQKRLVEIATACLQRSANAKPGTDMLNHIDCALRALNKIGKPKA
jgi:2-keto-3-deoxy-L-rhamnonate aldolase RhmA